MSTGPNALTTAIRKKYPGTYDDLSDADLTKQVLAKHPQYSDMVPEAAAALNPPRAPVPLPRQGGGDARINPSPLDRYQPEVLGAPLAPIGTGLLTAGKFAGSLAGSAVGSEGADALSDAFHLGPTARAYAKDAGSLIGGVLGTGSGAQAEEAAPGIRDAIGRAFRKPGKVTLSPGGELADAITKGPLKPIPKAVAYAGRIFGLPQIADAIIPAHPEPVGMTSNLGRIKPQRNMIDVFGNPKSADSSTGFQPDDLISRTRKITIPGDEPTPQDLKRAGDMTQAPLAKLKTLAKFGDKLAQNELNRRLKN